MAKSEHLFSTSTKKSQKQLTHTLIVTVSSNQNQIQTFSLNFSPIFGVNLSYDMTSGDRTLALWIAKRERYHFATLY
jgi:hypothetical protein